MRYARVAVQGKVHNAVCEDTRGENLLLDDGRHVHGRDVVWLPPTQPGTVVALGLNYADHVSELDIKAPVDPLVFLKGPNTLLGHNSVTRRPSDAKSMHYECELTVVIGRQARHVARADAYDYVRGYTVANDYVIREYIENYYRPNLRAKNRDGCTVVGPWFVDAADVANPMDLKMRTLVNGKVTQEGHTADMIYDIPYLIEYLTGFMTLNPGDLILTGTPKGVVYLQSGDTVVTEIDGIGRLENVIADDARFYGEPA